MIAAVGQFVREAVERSGAAAEQRGGGPIEALLPPPLQKALGCGEHVLLRADREAGPGEIPCGYGTDGLGVIAKLAIGGGRVASCRAALPAPKPRLPERFEGINVSVREIGVAPGLGRTLVGLARYTASCDETRQGLVTAAVTVPDAVPIQVPDLTALPLEPCGRVGLDASAVRESYKWLGRALRQKAAAALVPFREAITRRHLRDASRVERYFEEVAADMKKRIASRPGRDIEAKMAGLPDERRRRREQLAANFAIKVRLDVIGLVFVETPNMIARLEVRRRRHGRILEARWDGTVRSWAGLRCDGCGNPLFCFAMCDEARHVLCASCWDACGEGGRRPCFVCAGRRAPEPWKITAAEEILKPDLPVAPAAGHAGKQAARKIVLDVLESSGEWMTGAAICTAAALTPVRIRPVLGSLVKEGIVEKEGHARAARYKFARPLQPR